MTCRHFASYPETSCQLITDEEIRFSGNVSTDARRLCRIRQMDALTGHVCYK